MKILEISKKEYTTFHAVQFDGTNEKEIINWIKENYEEKKLTPIIIKAKNSLLIGVGESPKKCTVGDYIVMDNYNDFHVVNQASFEQKYNIIKEEEKHYDF